MKVQLTPVQWAAWLALQSVPAVDLLHRPRAALATRMQIGKLTAKDHLEDLIATKLVRKVGRQGVCVIRPGKGSVAFVAVDTLSKGRWSQALQPRNRQQGSARGGGGIRRSNSPSTLNAMSLFGDEFPDANFEVCSFCSSEQNKNTPAKKPEANGAKKPEPTGAEKAAEALAGKVRKIQALVRERPRGPKEHPEETAEGQLFVQLYEERRRKVDPGYQVTGSAARILLGTLKHFKKFKIGRILWGNYLDLVFEGHVQVTHGDCIFPPPANIRSSFWIDRFVASLGVRSRDVKQVERILKRGEFPDVTSSLATHAIYFADRQVYGRSMPPDLETANPPLWAMVQYLAKNIDEIGYDDDPGDAGKDD